jgi:hypothetical protein
VLFVLTVCMDTESYNVFTKQNKQRHSALWNANINAPRGTGLLAFSPKFQLHLHSLLGQFWIFYSYGTAKLVCTETVTAKREWVNVILEREERKLIFFNGNSLCRVFIGDGIWVMLATIQSRTFFSFRLLSKNENIWVYKIIILLWCCVDVKLGLWY